MGRKRMYAKWDVAAKEIEKVLTEEMGVKGVKSVRVVIDYAGCYNNICVSIDGSVKDNGVKWNDKPRKGCMLFYDRCSDEFEEKLRNYLNEKDKSILALRGGGEKCLFVQKV